MYVCIDTRRYIKTLNGPRKSSTAQLDDLSKTHVLKKKNSSRSSTPIADKNNKPLKKRTSSSISFYEIIKADTSLKIILFHLSLTCDFEIRKQQCR